MAQGMVVRGSRDKARKLLWSGSWGGNGSANLTVTGLSACTRLWFDMDTVGTVEVAKSGSMHVIGSSINSDNGNVHIYVHKVGANGNVLSVAMTRLVQCKADGTLTNAAYTSNQIKRIWGL